MKIFSSKKRVAVIGALTAVTLVGGGTAFAYWTTTGQGDGAATVGTNVADTDLTAAFTTAVDGPLTPGGPAQTTSVTITNHGTGVERVTSVLVSVAEPNGALWNPPGDCSASDFKVNTATVGSAAQLIDDPLLDFIDIAGTGTSTPLPVTIQMVETGLDQNSCRTLTVPLHVEVS